MLTPEPRSFRLSSEFRYLLSVPENPGPAPVAFVTLHGYGSTPGAMLRLTAMTAGSGHPIAALEGPNQFYPSGTGGEAGYNWGVGAHAESNVPLHHQMMLFVLGELRARFGVPAARCILVGFSQACGLNYRFLGTHPGQAGGSIAFCGGVPFDWETGPFAERIPASALHISRDSDEFYPVEKSCAFPDRLRRRIEDVEFHMLPGGHRFPSKSGPLVRQWLATRFGVPGS